MKTYQIKVGNKLVEVKAPNEEVAKAVALGKFGDNMDQFLKDWDKLVDTMVETMTPEELAELDEDLKDIEVK